MVQTDAEKQTQTPATALLPTKKPLIHRIAGHPWFAITGWLGTMAGVVLVFAIQDTPKFTYSVNPIRTSIVRSGQSSGLKVSYNGSQVPIDVTALQVAFWNAGNRLIRTNQVLEPIMFVISNAVPLEVQTLKISRMAVVRPNLAFVPISTNVTALNFAWNVLEKGDGCSIQIMYAGSASAPVSVTGVIEGQRHIFETRLQDARGNPLTVTLAFVLSGILLIFAVLSRNSASLPYRKILFWGFVLSYFFISAWKAWRYVTGPTFPF